MRRRSSKEARGINLFFARTSGTNVDTTDARTDEIVIRI
jgi:hypothetical protein